MIVAIGLLAVAVGTVVFHFWSPWWWTPIASNWGYIDDTIILTFWITGVVFIAVVLFMAYCVWRFKYKPEARSLYKPEDHKVEWWLTGLTTVGVAGMLIPGLFVWNQFITVPDDATEVEVFAQQWSWSYRLPGKDGKLGTSNVRLINDDNPFGVDPKDANGQDDVLIDGEDLHLPLNKPVKVLLRSIDVLHDFYVPEFRAKMDMVPGAVTYFWVEPTRAGTFDVLCFELCGVGHHAMRSQVVVESDAAYGTWLAQQTTFKQAAAVAKAKKPLAATVNGVDGVKNLVLRERSTVTAKMESVR
jgi:cytochrome c oxidase subunit 2